MIIQFFISFFCSIFLIKSLMTFFTKFFLDLPNYRSSHVKAIPSGGGIIFAICGCLFSLMNGIWFPLICFPLSIVSLIDDFRGLKPVYRYIVQFITALVLIFNSDIYKNILRNLPLASEIFLIFLLVIFGTAIMNFFNFMDGIDGILSSCMVIVFAIFAIKYLPFLWPLIGAILGFLIFNWHPAKIFMGDSGSTFIGSIFFGCILQVFKSIDDLSIFFLASPLLFDAFSCLLRRFYIGANIFKPHKMHIYQRLNQSGFSHQKVSLLYLSLTIFLALSYSLGNQNIYLASILLVIFFGILLDNKYAAPFKERRILKD